MTHSYVPDTANNGHAGQQLLIFMRKWRKGETIPNYPCFEHTRIGWPQTRAGVIMVQCFDCMKRLPYDWQAISRLWTADVKVEALLNERDQRWLKGMNEAMATQTIKEAPLASLG